ncbi:hypothetical protein ACWNT8_01945 [Pigmentibacter ruber]
MKFKKTIKYLSNIVISNIILINIHASELNVNYDLPIKKKELSVGKSKFSNSIIRRNCYKYSDYVIVEEVDNGLKGAAQIGIEPTKKSSNFLEICKKKYQSFKIKMIAEGYYGGKINQFIINDGNDVFGAEFLFQIFVIKSDKLIKVFEDLRHSNQKYEYLRNSKHSLGIRYWKSLKVENDCSINDRTCLEQIGIANKLPNDLNFNNCVKSINQRISALKNENSDISYLNNTSGNQFFIYIEIPDIYSSENSKVLDKNVKCESKP